MGRAEGIEAHVQDPRELHGGRGDASAGPRACAGRVVTPDAASQREIERAAGLIAAARSIVALTGAGVSAESGVPTFRGADGLWKAYRAEELATPQAFARDPRLVWEWYAWRREMIARCAPNAAHLALARHAVATPGRVRIVTQNVDGLHADAARAAASDETAAAPALPLELHGSIFRLRCTGCGARTPHRGAIDHSSADTLPRCERCDALLRPDVVWFGESLDPAVLDAAGRAAASADVCLVIGTSSIVYPAAGLASLALERGGTVIEINPDPTPLSRRVTLSLRARAGEIIDRLLGDAPRADAGAEARRPPGSA